MKHVRVEYIFSIFSTMFGSTFVINWCWNGNATCEAPFVGGFPFILKPCTLVVDSQWRTTNGYLSKCIRPSFQKRHDVQGYFCYKVIGC